MIFVAVIPGAVWIAVLLATWAALALLASRPLHIRRGAMAALLVVLAVQAALGILSAVATSVDPIDSFTCRMGLYGSGASAGLCLVAAALLGFLSRSWPRSAAGRRRRFVTWVSIWLAFSLAALLTPLRSLALCTV